MLPTCHLFGPVQPAELPVGSPGRSSPGPPERSSLLGQVRDQEALSSPTQNQPAVSGLKLTGCDRDPDRGQSALGEGGAAAGGSWARQGGGAGGPDNGPARSFAEIVAADRAAAAAAGCVAAAGPMAGTVLGALGAAARAAGRGSPLAESDGGGGAAASTSSGSGGREGGGGQGQRVSAAAGASLAINTVLCWPKLVGLGVCMARALLAIATRGRRRRWRWLVALALAAAAGAADGGAGGCGGGGGDPRRALTSAFEHDGAGVSAKVDRAIWQLPASAGASRGRRPTLPGPPDTLPPQLPAGARPNRGAAAKTEARR